MIPSPETAAYIYDVDVAELRNRMAYKRRFYLRSRITLLSAFSLVVTGLFCCNVVKMVSCAAVGCHHTSQTHKHLSWHAFPSDGKLRGIWIAKVKRENLPKNPKLCSAHFEPHMFKRNFMVSTSSIFK